MYAARSRITHPIVRRGTVALPYDDAWFPGAGLLRATTLAASGAWTTANTAVGYWVTAPYDCTVYRMGWVNGSSAAGNHDVAIYDSDGTTRLVSAGSTAASGASSWQWVNTTDQALTGGKDYFIAANHSATSSHQCWTILTSAVQIGPQLLMEIKEQAVGATALPNPFVPADPSTAKALPIIGLWLNPSF